MPDGGGRSKVVEAMPTPPSPEENKLAKDSPDAKRSEQAVERAVSPEIDPKQVDQLCAVLERGSIHDIQVATKDFAGWEEVIYHERVQEGAKRAVQRWLDEGSPYAAQLVISKFQLYGAFHGDEEFATRVRERITDEIAMFGKARFRHDNAEQIKRYAQLLPWGAVEHETVQAMAMRKLWEMADEKNFYEASNLLQAIPVKDVATIPALQEYAEGEVKRTLLGYTDDRARELISEYNISRERVCEIVDESARTAIADYNHYYFYGLQKQWGWAMDEPEAYEPLAKEAYLKALGTANYDGLNSINWLKSTDEFRSSPEVREAAKEGLLYQLKHYLEPSSEAWREKTGLPDSIYKEPEIQAALRLNILRHAGHGTYNDAEKALKRAENFGIALSGPYSEEEKEYVEHAFAYPISRGDENLRDRLKAAFGVDDDIVKGGARVAVINCFTEGYTHYARICDEYELPASLFREPEAQEAAKKGFAIMIRERRMEDAKAIQDLAELDREEVRKMVVHEISESIKHEHSFDRGAGVARVYGKEVHDLLGGPEMQKMALEGLAAVLKKGDIESSVVLEETFDLPDERCYELATEAFIHHLANGDVAASEKIQRQYHIPKEVTWQPDAQAAAMKGLRANFVSGRIDQAYALTGAVPLWNDAMRKIAAEAIVELLEKGNFEHALLVKGFEPDLLSPVNFEPDFTSAQAQVPFGVLIKLPDVKSFEALYAKDKWRDAVERLLKLQARAAKAEHDPWVTDMSPLVARLVGDGVVDRQKAEDGEVLVEYVKTFGMYNLPQMAQVFIELKRGATFEQLKDETKDQLRIVVGKRAERMTGEQIINELRQFQRGMQGQLLEEKIPKGIETRMGEEIFSGIKGATTWGRGDSIAEIVALQRKRVEGVETAEAPAEIRERTFQVPLVVRDKPQETAEGKDKVAAVLARKSGEKQTELGVFFGMLEMANVDAIAMTKSQDAWWDGRRTQLIAKMTFDPKELEATLAQREEELRAKGNPPGKIEKILAGVRGGFEKKRQQAEEQQAKLRNVEYPKSTGDKEADDRAFIAAMEAITVVGKIAGAREMLLALSMEHIRRVDPQWGERFGKAMGAPGSAITQERLAELEGFYVQYLNEHYLNRTAGPEHTGHAKFSDTLLDALEGSWARGKDLQKHVLVQKKSELEAITSGGGVASKETMAVTRVRSKGLLLTYAGDIGDACYTSKHKELAQGDFSGIEAEIFVTNRGTAQERLQGSALHIETKTPAGERVLMLRANNPRENLIAQVDAESFIRTTIDDAIDKAKELGIDMVVVPLDAASASCSNRPAVAEYYKKHYGKAEKIDLVNEPATNFNGYPNWNKDGTNPVVVVWRREKGK